MAADLIDGLVTVIIPCYNHESFVAESIMSVVNQDYQNIELIVLDDGSSDGTAVVVSGLEQVCVDRFVRYEFVQKKNEGLAITLNKGVYWSKGDYVTVIASDDLMRPDKVSKLYSFLAAKDSRYGLSFGDAEFIDESGCGVDLVEGDVVVEKGAGCSRFIDYYTQPRPDVTAASRLYDYGLLVRGNYLPAMSVMWRRAALVDVGMFTPGVVLEDWDLWLRMARNYSAVFIEDVISDYRVHPLNSVKTMKVKMLRCQQDIWMRELLRAGSNNLILKKSIARLLLRNIISLIRCGDLKASVLFLNINIIYAAIR
jgi:alpha-1,3-rhamnosyltransferase